MEGSGPQPDSSASSEHDSNVVSAPQLSALTTILTELISNLENLRSVSEATTSASVAQMERIAIVAGATLTLSFSIVSTLGARLAQLGIQASAVTCLKVACWSFIIAIILAVLVAGNLPVIQSKRSVALSLSSTSTKMRLSLLNLTNNAKSLELPELGDLTDLSKTDRVAKIITVLANVSRLCLFTGFVLLGIFLQRNVQIILSGRR